MVVAEPPVLLHPVVVAVVVGMVEDIRLACVDRAAGASVVVASFAVAPSVAVVGCRRIDLVVVISTVVDAAAAAVVA